MDQKKFPFGLFAVYVLLYSCIAIYGTYLNLYLSEIGFSKTQIGSVVSVSTAFTLIAQLVWGSVSDRASNKNNIIKLLFLGSCIIALLFYTSQSYVFMLMLIALFSSFFYPVGVLQDSVSLQILEKSKWDFGHVRMGGTLGYAIAVLVVGYFLKDEYSPIFLLVSIMTFLCFATVLTLPKIQGTRKGSHKASFKEIFENKAVACFIFFNLIHSLGFSFYYSFYPIYFTTIGGDSFLIGLMMFLGAMAEVPFLILGNKMVKRFGVAKVMMAAGTVTGIRWLLLYLISNPILAIAVNLLNGFSFMGFHYSMTMFLDTNVPKDLKSTGHSVNSFITTFFSRIVFGYIGGLASDAFGTDNMMLVSGIVTLTGVIAFTIWLSRIERVTDKKYLTA